MLLRCLPKSGQTVSGSSPQETPGSVLEATQRCERRRAPDDWTGHRFTDLFTLLKVDGEWKIMNKVFHLHA
jgi:putative lumazine-binding protein